VIENHQYPSSLGQTAYAKTGLPLKAVSNTSAGDLKARLLI